MWYTIITVIHVIACVFLATVVLLQQGKGSDVTAVFGGSSQTLFGSSGAGNALTKLTSASAVIFMITSLTLSYGAARQSTKSLFDSEPASAPAPAVAPEAPPAATSETAPAAQSAATPATPATSPAPPAATAPAATAPTAATTSTANPQPATPPPAAPAVPTAPAATPPATTTK